MKRGLVLVSLIFVILLFSFVSAFSFADFWSKITGRVTSSCMDTDGGINYEVKGTVYSSIESSNDSSNDYCYDNYQIVESYCHSNNSISIIVYHCPNGCSNGTCLSASNQTCTPAMKCQSAYYKGYQSEDCQWSDVAYCSYGCSNGACNSPPSNETQNQTCMDECNTTGQKLCFGSYKKTCGSYDSDNCLEFDSGTYCSYGCSNGDCNSAPTNQTTNQTNITCTPAVKCQSTYYKGYQSEDCQWSDVAYCSYGCSNGACNSLSSNETQNQTWEKIKCIFKNSKALQKCYTAGQNSRVYCSGAETCLVDISGYLGENITWKSSCGGYAYTTMDWKDESIEFDCIPKQGINETEIKDNGFRFAYWQCHDGTEMNFGDNSSCYPGEALKNKAREFCKNRCKNQGNISKCGVNSFSVLKECYSNAPSTNASSGGVPLAETLICKDSCPLDNKCYPFGYRKSGKYCSDAGQFVAQLEEENPCNNNFECSSNVCVNGGCISGSFIQRIIEWFKKLFGTQ